MNVHEYQGKEILRKFGVATPRGVPCFSVADADAAARELGGKVWVVKAQIHAGGRGKGGGVKVAKSLDEVHRYAAGILGMTLVTHQTGPEGRVVHRLLVEEGADIRKELYVGMVVDRGTQRVTLIASSEGGMEIEEVAAHSAGKNSQGGHRSGRGTYRLPGRGHRAQDRRARGVGAAGTPLHARSVSRLLRMRCLACRDQSADPDRRRQGACARCQAQLRRQCAVPPPRHRRDARSRRRGSGRGRGIEVRSVVYLARRATSAAS